METYSWSDVANTISETMAKLNEPLTDNQKVILAGVLAVWIQKIIEETKAENPFKSGCV